MAYMFMAYIVVACIIMACIVMAYLVMAYTLMACIIFIFVGPTANQSGRLPNCLLQLYNTPYTIIHRRRAFYKRRGHL